MTIETEAILHIGGHETADNTVSVDVFVRLLQGMQQLSLLFAAAAEKRPMLRRFRPPDEIRRRYRLRCGTLAPGSYVVPLQLVDESEKTLLEDEAVLKQMFEFIGAAAEGDSDQVAAILPDSPYRERALRTLQAFAPKRGERWTAAFGVGHAAPISLNGKLTRNIDQMLLQGLEEIAVMTVTGELIGVQFDEYKLTIRHPVTQRALECNYLPDTEVDLLESRRGFIQVTGEFTLDADGYPKRLTNVNKIEAVDLSPLEFEVIERDGRVLTADPPLVLLPELDEESQQLFVVSNAGLDLQVCAFTRQELADEVAQHVLFAWDTYAQEHPEQLTEAAQQLREAYLDRFQEVTHAEA